MFSVQLIQTIGFNISNNTKKNIKYVSIHNFEEFYWRISGLIPVIKIKFYFRQLKRKIINWENISILTYIY